MLSVHEAVAREDELALELNFRGYVETVNSHGHRVDESGRPNLYDLSKFQYLFRPGQIHGANFN